jgi:hypothetical protein
MIGFPGMKRPIIQASLLAVCIALECAAHAASPEAGAFKKDFNVDKSELSSTGTSPYFVLEPGFTAVFEGKDQGKTTVLTITVKNETKIVNGVETRVVDEKEAADGVVTEISHNYFAISRKTGDVYYFGEATDEYQNGKKTHGADSWLSGVNGAHFGLGMPAHPEKGMRFQQEVAPGVAMDRAEVVSTDAAVKTPAGEFSHCVETEETTPLEAGKEYKYYAPRIGLLQDDQLKYVKSGFPGRQGITD